MGRVLYRKYRSKNLSEIIGQDHITKTLSNAIKSGQISHAYLFTGPRGVGKTSIARILAHEVNGLKYDEENSNVIDIIEIDAASNRRIDEIRDLREKVHIAPALTKYKVYIIDEVHMLTKEAFNALLKTLEEPPEHAIFILATTEAHKVPETISSRTQQFKFRPISVSAIAKHLEKISKNENIKIDNDALNLIAQHGQGSFRDSINLLDQAKNFTTNISVKDIETILGIAPESIINKLIEAIEHHSLNKAEDIIEKIKNEGFSYPIISKQLIRKIRNQLIMNDQKLAKLEALDLMQNLNNVSSSTDPEISFELAILESIIKRSDPTDNDHKITKNKEEKFGVKSEVAHEESSIKADVSKKANFSKNLAWEEFMTEIKNQHNTLYSVMRVTVPVIKENKLILKSKFAFHQKRLLEDKNRTIILKILKSLTNKDFELECVTEGKYTETDKKKNPTLSNNALETISNIFGKAEMLE